MKLLEATIKAIVVDRPDPDSHPQNLCLDKGYDGRTAELQLRRLATSLRFAGRERRSSIREGKRYPARRWVVERTLAWLQKCRAILIRYDKKASNYLGLLQLACALLWYRCLHRLREAIAT